MFESLNNIEKLLGQAFQDAPRQLNAIIVKISEALEKKRLGKKSCGEALSELRRAQSIIEEDNLVEWQAELHALRAYYYLLDCPNLERDGRNEEQAMWYHIQEAQRLEPANERLSQIVKIIKAADQA